MNELITPVAITPPTQRIMVSDSLLCIGSCFADAFAQRLTSLGLSVLANPFGTLYNAASIEACLTRIVSGHPFVADELIRHDGLYHSMMHHTRFSHAEQVVCLQHINESLADAHARLSAVQWVVVTLGTAWVFEMNGQVVGNCHKLPAQQFTHRRMLVDEVRQCLMHIVDLLPDKRFVFTVSPIRHKGGSLHQNQLSKATLLLAEDEVCTTVGTRCCYFPSYEIMLDELRDYRFTAADMMHPTDVAADYICERFVSHFLTDEAQTYCREQERLLRQSRHIPFR